ncbi:predicted protein [Verticillium alfalfae VaMs.102]|uniref:Predicted protein n=1 Tax=Verticillium alfalfae (strain VaMs.102 / ATCC MYA-4576 / FGSC 10136) TaxID=526221 RepID=C9SQ57_VERA1|nr:predicted protein [Verticillium alfalfae VaMs.102]EEY20982.1 predicted protein [Verticillium alfalfae VaMs.102]
MLTLTGAEVTTDALCFPLVLHPGPHGQSKERKQNPPNTAGATTGQTPVRCHKIHNQTGAGDAPLKLLRDAYHPDPRHVASPTGRKERRKAGGTVGQDWDSFLGEPLSPKSSASLGSFYSLRLPARVSRTAVTARNPCLLGFNSLTMSGRSAHVRKKINTEATKDGKSASRSRAKSAASHDRDDVTISDFPMPGNSLPVGTGVGTTNARFLKFSEPARDMDHGSDFRNVSTMSISSGGSGASAERRDQHDYGYRGPRRPNLKTEDVSGIEKSGFRNILDKKSDDVRKGLAKTFTFRRKDKEERRGSVDQSSEHRPNSVATVRPQAYRGNNEIGTHACTRLFSERGPFMPPGRGQRQQQQQQEDLCLKEQPAPGEGPLAAMAPPPKPEGWPPISTATGWPPLIRALNRRRKARYQR